MAVTISAADLGDAAQLTGEQATRLLPVAMALVEQFAPRRARGDPERGGGPLRGMVGAHSRR